MNISDWPIPQIMQLPDHCFGRRWKIAVSAELTDAAAVFDISEAGLPERCVIWEIIGVGSGQFNISGEASLVLGDNLPATDAEFWANEMLLRDDVSITGVRSTLSITDLSEVYTRNIRMLVESAGRRLIGRFIRTTGESLGMKVAIVVSSVPRSVPDCLFYRT